MTSQCMGAQGGHIWVLSFPLGWGLTPGEQLPKLPPQLPDWTKLRQLPSTWRGIMDMMSTKEGSCTAVYFQIFSIHLQQLCQPFESNKVKIFKTQIKVIKAVVFNLYFKNINFSLLLSIQFNSNNDVEIENDKLIPI